MARRSRIKLEFDVKKLGRSIKEKFKELPINLKDFSNTELYEYEKALKTIIKALKPYTFD